MFSWLFFGTGTINKGRLEVHVYLTLSSNLILAYVQRTEVFNFPECSVFYRVFSLMKLMTLAMPPFCGGQAGLEVGHLPID